MLTIPATIPALKLAQSAALSLLLAQSAPPPLGLVWPAYTEAPPAQALWLGNRLDMAMSRRYGRRCDPGQKRAIELQTTVPSIWAAGIVRQMYRQGWRVGVYSDFGGVRMVGHRGPIGVVVLWDGKRVGVCTARLEP